MSEMSENESTYCQICDACGEAGCCSPLGCHQHVDGDYCGDYLADLKFGYHMNVWFFNNILDKIPEDMKQEYMKEWDEQYSRFYDNKND